MADLNLVQQGGELTYLLLHDPEFRSRVRQHHLYEVGRRIRLKQDIDLLYQFLSQGFDIIISTSMCCPRLRRR